MFSVVTGSICFVFCFRLNIFASKISDLLLPLGVKRAKVLEAMNLDISFKWQLLRLLRRKSYNHQYKIIQYKII